MIIPLAAINTLQQLFTGTPWYNDYQKFLLFNFFVYPLIISTFYLLGTTLRGGVLKARSVMLLSIVPSTLSAMFLLCLFLYAIADAFFLSVLVDWMSLTAFYGVQFTVMFLLGILAVAKAVSTSQESSNS